MFIYSILIYFYVILIRIAALWNKKAALWINGRKQWQIRLKHAIAAAAGKKIIWVHCASLGEFEQGRPIIENLKSVKPDIYILLTFFSPSGYEVRKNYSTADLVCYLPADTPANAREFLNLTCPQVVIFVKYEYWFNIIRELKHRNIPALMVSGIFFEKQFFFQWFGKWAQQYLHVFKMIFVQDLKSEELLRKIGITNLAVAGDTRFDRVISIAAAFKHISEIQIFCINQFTYVLGSTWEEDEHLWHDWIKNHPEHRFIIAPHDISEEHILEIEKRWQGCIRFSQLKEDNLNNGHHILIIDNIGMLSMLYYYADITYVGGGFGDGIHNTLEAAVYGKPVLFGPEHEIFTEAKGLVQAHAGFVIENSKELEHCLTLFINDPRKLKDASTAASDFVIMNAGATERIMHYIQENLLFSSNPN